MSFCAAFATARKGEITKMLVRSRAAVRLKPRSTPSNTSSSHAFTCFRVACAPMSICGTRFSDVFPVAGVSSTSSQQESSGTAASRRGVICTI